MEAENQRGMLVGDPIVRAACGCRGMRATCVTDLGKIYLRERIGACLATAKAYVDIGDGNVEGRRDFCRGELVWGYGVDEREEVFSRRWMGVVWDLVERWRGQGGVWISALVIAVRMQWCYIARFVLI